MDQAREGGAQRVFGSPQLRAMIHLDTSFLILSLVKGSAEDRSLRAWLGAGDSLGIAAPAWAEFLCGPVRASEIALAGRLLGTPVAFSGPEAEEAAKLFNATGRRRATLLDCMIAATAISSGVPLATSNVADFRRFVARGLTMA